MSQTDAIFAQTSDQLIFSASKVERATATDLSWLSTYSYKKDRTQQSPLKGCWPGAQRDQKKNTEHRVCRCFSFSISSLYAAVLRMRPWGGLSGVDGGHKLFRQRELLLLFFLHRLFVPLKITMLWIRPLAPNPPSPQNSCLINKPATSQSSSFQPSVQFWSFSAETTIFAGQLLQNVLRVADQLQVEWCRSSVSNSGPCAKFGPQCTYIWPAKASQMTIRAGLGIGSG